MSNTAAVNREKLSRNPATVSHHLEFYVVTHWLSTSSSPDYVLSFVPLGVNNDEASGKPPAAVTPGLFLVYV